MTIEFNILFNNGRAISAKGLFYDIKDYETLMEDITNGDSEILSIKKSCDDTIRKLSRLNVRRKEVLSIDMDCSS